MRLKRVMVAVATYLDDLMLGDSDEGKRTGDLIARYRRGNTDSSFRKTDP